MAEGGLTRTMTGTLALLYHNLSNAGAPVAATAAERSIVLSDGQFREQLQHLSDPAFQVVSLDQALQPKPNSDVTRVVITFDDGDLSNHTIALPVLAEYGMVATFYVVTDWIDRDPNYMTTGQLRELDGHGMTIGSHSCSHPFLPTLTPSTLRHEIRGSKQALEDILGHEVKHFALPGGHYNKGVLSECWSSGFASVATCKPGQVQASRRTVPRVEIRSSLTLDAFRRTFSRRAMMQLAAVECGKSAIRNSIGLKNYAAIRLIAHRHMTITR